MMLKEQLRLTPIETYICEDRANPSLKLSTKPRLSDI